MSRSKKKPIIKDGDNSTKEVRRMAHKKMRQAVRARLAHADYDMIPTDESEFVNDFDICDWRHDLRWEQTDPDGWTDNYLARAARK